MFKRLNKMIILFLLICILFPLSGLGNQQENKVFVLSIKGEIETGLAKYVKRSLSIAQQKGARAVIVEIDTFGGRADSAIKIRDLLLAQDFPVYAFIHNRAWSAGALIALAADQIFMAPGSSIGAAEPRVGTLSSTISDEKVVSAFRSEFESTAERTKRDPEIAAAMVDSRVEIPGLVERGQLLSLSAEKALNLNFIDGIKNSIFEILEKNDLIESKTIQIELNWGEKLSRFVTHPFVSPLILTLGILGLVIEIFTPGWGVGGSIGLFSLTLYFAGHIMAGVAGWEAVALFIIGLVLILLEIFVIPGIGITGVLGFLGLVTGILLAATSVKQAVISLLVAFTSTILIAFFVFRYFKGGKSWDQLILNLKQDQQSGYIAHKDVNSYLGKIGLTITPLRPAGTARFDEHLLDVISEGNFVEKNIQVRIIRVEGGKIIVRPLIIEENEID